jgi:hypothetical protein
MVLNCQPVHKGKAHSRRRIISHRKPCTKGYCLAVVHADTCRRRLHLGKFKELFLARFSGKETATSALMKMLAEPRLEDESLGAYGTHLCSLLGARWDHLTAVEIVNATVLHHLSLRDERVEKIALTSDVKTRDKFITEMSAFHYAKKRLTPSSGTSSAGPKAKRRKPSDPRIKCHHCGVPGHKIAKCRTRMKTEGQETTRRLEKSRPAVSSKVSCFKCREKGHIAPNCPLLRKNKPRLQ